MKETKERLRKRSTIPPRMGGIQREHGAESVKEKVGNNIRYYQEVRPQKGLKMTIAAKIGTI